MSNDTELPSLQELINQQSAEYLKQLSEHQAEQNLIAEQKLLELAAKAVGLKWDRYGIDGDGNWWTGTKYLTDWNPLTNDGDALRLAVELRLDIEFAPEATWLGIKVDAIAPLTYEAHRGDSYGATRRAIVRAAAEIGRGMP